MLINYDEIDYTQPVTDDDWKDIIFPVLPARISMV